MLFALSCVREFDPEPDQTGQLRVTPNPIDMSSNLFGGTLPVRLTNVGTDTLRVDSIRVNNSALTISANTPFEIHPERNTRINLRFRYDIYDGSGDAEAIFYVKDEDPLRVQVRTPFKRILLNLSDHASNNYGVAFTSNGVDVLYYSDRNGSYDIRLVDRVGDNDRSVTNDEFNNIPVAFTSNNSAILFYSDRDGYNQAYLIQIGSGEITKVTDTEIPAYPVGLSENDNLLLYYTVNQDNERDAWLRNIDTGQTTLLNENVEESEFDRFRPVTFIESETRVLMQGQAGTKSKMFIVNRDGDNPINVIDDDWNYIPIDYSNSDLRILAWSNRELRRNIYSINVQGTQITQITNSPRLDFPVALSPNDAFILFYSDRDGSIDVYVTNAQGSSTDRITADPYDDIPVTFAPNNNTMLFNSDRNTYGGTRYTQVYATDLN